MVRPHVAAYWNKVPTEGRAPHAEFLTHLAPTRKIYAKANGRIHAVGDTLVNRDMAATLKRLASAGVEDFYRGEIGTRITADMKANGGLLSEADLAASQIEQTAPLWGTYRGLKIATNPPPGGGLMLSRC
jgi:gamma-glutamyltranspeptidase/glutathione hydrolase